MTREEAKRKLFDMNCMHNDIADEHFILLMEIYDDFEKQQLENLAHLQMANSLIEKLKAKLDKYENPYDEDTIISSDLSSGSGYLDGHAWIGRVKPSTKYKIIVIEAIDAK